MTQQSKPKTKKSQLIQMLSRKAGIDVATISKQLGWQPHTTRAAMSGLRKSGYELAADKPTNGKARRPAPPISPARRPRDGCSCQIDRTMAGFPAARWIVRA